MNYDFKTRTFTEFKTRINEIPLKTYGPGRTVLLHALAFATMVGCNPIYVIGFDWDYRKGYTALKNNDGDYESLSDPPSIDGFTDEVMEDLKMIRDLSKNVGTKIYNLNEKSWHHVLDVFSYEDFLKSIR